MTQSQQNEMRSAVDTVTSLLRDCLDEPGNTEHQQALVTAVHHFNQLGYGFKLTREYVQCRRIHANTLRG
jgi:hypothetical protein